MFSCGSFHASKGDVDKLEQVQVKTMEMVRWLELTTDKERMKQ